MAFIVAAGEAQEYTTLRAISGNVNKAKKALGEAGLSYTEGALEQFELANKPGALAVLAGKLAKKGINIDCAYATVHKSTKKAVVVLALSGPAV